MMLLEEINKEIKEINAQLSYIRKRNKACCAFGSDQEEYELTQRREELRKEKRKCSKT